MLKIAWRHARHEVWHNSYLLMFWPSLVCCLILEFWENHFQCRYPSAPLTPYNQVSHGLGWRAAVEYFYIAISNKLTWDLFISFCALHRIGIECAQVGRNSLPKVPSSKDNCNTFPTLSWPLPMLSSKARLAPIKPSNFAHCTFNTDLLHISLF